MARTLVFPCLAVALLAGGCAVYTKGIRPDAALNPQVAYLYGRFFMKTQEHVGSFRGRQSMGLVIRCEDGRTYTFGSSDTRDVQVLAVRPSRCWLIEAAAADQEGIVHQRIPADRSIQRPLQFSAGRAHYLGDYFARGDFRAQHMFRGWQLFWRWAMDPADDRYESTTAEMKQTFRNLAWLPTVDMRLVPAAPPPKRGNGIGPSPGEPPMSPERVARIVPFAKRSYASPAECEAACPAGQCLPYRGESGVAMACIVRCNVDKDCPEGLACNCPNSERAGPPDCQPIATLPQEPMARVCLSVEAAGQRR